MAETTPGPQTETKLQKAKRSLKRHFLAHRYRVMILGFLVLLMVVFFNLNPGARQNEDAFKSEPLEFGLIEASPRDSQANANSEIVLKFNFPVTAHHVQEYISISQNPTGAWVQGDSANTIIFKPTSQFYTGSFVEVVLREGLPSDAGKKLAADYSFRFSVRLAGEDMRFIKGDITEYYNASYRLSGFSVNQGIALSILLGDQIKQPRLVLYKAPNENGLLQDFSYNRRKLDYPGPQNDSSIIWQSDYSSYRPDVKDFTEVKSFDLSSSTNVSHKGDIGIYYLAGYDGDKLIEDSWAVINKTGIFFRQDDQKFVLAAQDLTNGQELKNVPVSIYQMEGKAKIIRTNVINGITEIPFDYPNRADLIVAKVGQENVFVPVYMPNTRAEIKVGSNLGKQLKVFLTVDRPIYKPGDTVKYRGVVRIDNDSAYLVPVTGTAVKIKYGANMEGTIENKTDSAGVISGEFVIPKNLEVPYAQYAQSITAQLSEYEYLGGVNYEIANYTKPNFDINVTLEDDDLIKKDVVKATIHGELLTKEPLKNTKVSYIVYRRDYYETEKSVYNSSFRLTEWGGMCGGGFGIWDEYYGEEVKKGEVTLDANGNAVVEFPTADMGSIISQEITIVASREDKGNNISGAKTAVVHAGDFKLFLNNRTFVIDSGESFEIPFKAETDAGQPIANREFNFKIYKVEYNNNGTPKNTTIKSGKVSSNSEGRGVVNSNIAIEGEWTSLFLEVSATDGRGNTVGASRYLNVVPKGQPKYVNDPILNVVSAENNLITGNVAELKIGAPSDMKVFMSFERGRIYDAQWLDLKKGENTFKFNVKNSYMPSITPTFTFFYNNEYHIEGLSLNVPAMQNVVNVSVTTDKEDYKPGETVKVTIKATDSKNQPVVADVGAAVVDKAIFALRKNAAPPFHSSLYYFRPRSTNASSSMSGITFNPWDEGGRGGGGGGAADSKLVDTLYWNPNLKTNLNGEVTFEVLATDYLTSWRIQAYASTSDTKVGQGSQDFTVN